MAAVVTDMVRRHTLSQILVDLVKFAVGSAIDGSRKIIPGHFFCLFQTFVFISLSSLTVCLTLHIESLKRVVALLFNRNPAFSV